MTITTVRRLLLEVGVIGDLDAKTKLEEFQESANSLKQTLIDIEKSLEVISKSGSIGGFTSFLPSLSIPLTPKEQTQQRETEQKIRDNENYNRQRDERQIQLTEQQITLQERLIQTLQEQIEGQRSLINDVSGDATRDRTLFANISQSVEGILDETISQALKTRQGKRSPLQQYNEPHFKMPGAYDRSEEPGHEGEMLEKPINPKWVNYWNSYDDYIARMKDVKMEMTTLRQEMEVATDPKEVDKIWEKMKALQESSLQARKDIEEYKKTSNEEILNDLGQQLDTIREYRTQHKNGLEELESIRRQQQEQKQQVETPKEVLSKTEVPEDIKNTPEDPRPPMFRMAIIPKGDKIVNARTGEEVDQFGLKLQPKDEIDDLEESITRLRQQQEKPDFEGLNQRIENTKKIEPKKRFFDNSSEYPDQFEESTTPREKYNEVFVEAINKRMQNRTKQQESTTEESTVSLLERIMENSPIADFSSRKKITSEVENEFTRKRMIKDLDKIRAPIQEEMQHDEDIYDRGFAFKPFEAVREFGKGTQRKFENWKEEKEDQLKGWVSKLPGFQSAQEYFGEKREARENLAEKIIGSPQNEQLAKQYIVNINNPTLDNDERKNQLIREIEMALRGL